MENNKWAQKHDKCIICNTTIFKHKAKGFCTRCYQKAKQPPIGICSGCGETAKLPLLNSNKERICYKCYEQPKHVCSICNCYDKAEIKINNNDYVCRKCYSKSFIPKSICSLCGKEDIIKKVLDDMKLCQYCYNKHYRPKKPCSKCGQIKLVHMVTSDGYSICTTCYTQLYRPKRLCSICGITDLIEKKENGLDICVKCYSKYYAPKRICSLCKIFEKVHIIVDGSDVCKSCYEKNYRPKQLCSVCGKENVTTKVLNSKSICPNCYTRLYQPKRICMICGDLDIIGKKTDFGDVCIKCYNKFYRPSKVCFICGLESSTHKIANSNSICNRCYQKHFQPERICYLCGKTSKIACSDEQGDICRHCYATSQGVCNNCGKITNKFFRVSGFCPACWYYKKAIDFTESYCAVFKDPDLFNLLISFRNTLLRYRTSKVAYAILIRNISFFLYIDEYHIPINSLSLEFINEISGVLDCGDISNLENFLTSLNIVKPYEPLYYFYKSRDNYSKDMSESYVKPFFDYTEHLVSLRTKFENRGWHYRFTWKTCTNYMYLAQFFLRYVSTRVPSIQELNNDIIEAFCSENSFYMVSNIRPFLKWINKNIRLFKKLQLPNNYSTPIGGRPYSEEELFDIIENLSAEGVSYRDKFIGFLTLIYTIRPYEMRGLKISDIKRDLADVKIRIRGVSIALHPAIAELLDKYLALERNEKLSLGCNHEWLFTGKKYTKPMSTTYICEVLRQYNINSIRAFSTSITNLISSDPIPPSVLIRGLGISISTIISYYKALNIENMNAVNAISCESKSSDHNNAAYETNSKYFVYILKCSDGSYYTGSTSKLEQRLAQHSNGTGSKYTQTRRPIQLVYREDYDNKSSALSREKKIKKLDIYKKEQLIETGKLE